MVLGSPLSSLELPSLLHSVVIICPWSGERWVGGWDHTLAISFCRRDIASHLHTVTHVCFASVRSTRHRVPTCTSSHTFVAPRRPARPSRRFSGSLGCSQARWRLPPRFSFQSMSKVLMGQREREVRYARALGPSRAPSQVLLPSSKHSGRAERRRKCLWGELGAKTRSRARKALI